LFQIIPVAIGLTSTIAASLARIFFSWTLHAIVYFWLMPTYIISAARSRLPSSWAGCSQAQRPRPGAGVRADDRWLAASAQATVPGELRPV
jgi:hypothetical protein